MSQMMNQGMGMNKQQQQQQPKQQYNQPAPPPPPTVQFFTVVNGQQKGPYSTEQLSQMAAQKTISPDTLVWKQGMSNWTAAKSVPELTNIFTPSAPPPPPPPPSQ